MPTTLPPRIVSKPDHPALAFVWVIGMLTVGVLALGLTLTSPTPYEFASDTGIVDGIVPQMPMQATFR